MRPQASDGADLNLSLFQVIVVVAIAGVVVAVASPAESLRPSA